MKTVKGVFEKGEIKFLEELKFKNSQPKKVLVTFLDDEAEDDIVRFISLQQSTASFKEYLNDENEDLYQDYLTKK